MAEDLNNKFDLSQQRRKYFSRDCGLTSCPECGLPLVEDSCTVLISLKSEADEGEIMSNLTGSHFCQSCPVVVFDSDKIEQAAKIGIRAGRNLSYSVEGIVDLQAVPKEKRHLELGTTRNPLPLVQFLTDLKKIPVINQKKMNRNEPCPCGSGKKYKKCCG